MGRAIAADDDLLLGVVQRIERVKELGLGALFSRDELHVVNQEHVDGTVPLAEIDDPVVAHRVDHLVHETLGGDVRQLEALIVMEHVLSDRMHQVRLPKTHAAIDEQRVVGPRRRLRDRATGGVSELIGRADDERVERVSRIEARRAGHLHHWCNRHGGRAGFNGRHLLRAQRDACRVVLSSATKFTGR